MTLSIYDQLRRDEGDAEKMYQDKFGNYTIGVGHNLSTKGLSQRARQMILEDDVTDAVADLHRVLPWTAQMQDTRFLVLVNLVHNMGIGDAKTGTGLLGFSLMLHAIQQSDWTTAANELLDSRYAKQVGERANRLAQQLITNQMQ